MAGVNKAILVGNLGADPEYRKTPNDKSVVNFNVATTRTWSRDGNKEEATEWHRVVAWEGLAETCNKYLKKGSAVFIEGRIQTRSWEDDKGVKRYTTEILAYDMQMLDRKPDSKPQIDTDGLPF